MPKRSFEACIFDLFDTLVYFSKEDYLEKVRKSAALCGMNENEYLSAWKASGMDSILGRYPTTADRVRSFLTAVGIEAKDSLLQSLTSLEHEFLRDKTFWYEDAPSTLTELRRIGIKLGLVTNASPSVWEVIRSRRIQEFMDQLVISSETMMVKPDIRIYSECLRRCACNAVQSAYVGDGNDRELEGAKKTGLFTILVKRNKARIFESEQSSKESADAVIDDLSLLPRLLRAR